MIAAPVPPPASDDHRQLSWQELEALLRTRFQVIELAVEAAGTMSTLLKPRSADDLLDEDDFDRYERLPYWAEAWPSSKVLAEFVAGSHAGSNPLAHLPASAHVKPRLLELGCGLGWVSLTATRAGFDVTATDYYAEALDFARVNAARNGATEPNVRLVDWRRYPEDLAGFDTVIGSDVLYEKGNGTLVAAAMARSLAPQGIGLVTDPGRKHAATFLDDCQTHGLTARRIDRITSTVDQLTQPIDVYEIRRR